MSASSIYFSPVYDGTLSKITLSDQYGEVDFYMLPFLKPANVRRFYPDSQINDYTDAIRVALDAAQLNHNNRKVLLCHQNVTDPTSGERVVGGLDNVDASVFEAFDYVALGHIHLSYSVLRDCVRYSGTNLCYDFDQCEMPRSIDMVTMNGDGSSAVEHLPFTPLHPMMRVRGTLSDLCDITKADNRHINSYLHVILTDEHETVDAIGRLRAVYPLMLRLDYDNTRTRTQGYVLDGGRTDDKSPYELFCEFYNIQNGCEMDDEQTKEIADIIEQVWGCTQ